MMQQGIVCIVVHRHSESPKYRGEDGTNLAGIRQCQGHKHDKDPWQG